MLSSKIAKIVIFGLNVELPVPKTSSINMRHFFFVQVILPGSMLNYQRVSTQHCHQVSLASPSADHAKQLGICSIAKVCCLFLGAWAIPKRNGGSLMGSSSLHFKQPAGPSSPASQLSTSSRPNNAAAVRSRGAATLYQRTGSP